MNWKILHGDAETMLKTLPDCSVNCCVTSPPYYALRDYGVEGQIGLEETPEQYIEKLVAVFHEVKRVLCDDGTLWVNIGDSYWGSGSRGFDFTGKFTEVSEIQNGSKGTVNLSNVPRLIGKRGDCKNKDLIGIPWMLAFALRADGWYLRQDIIWSKPNPMPESVTDRCTRSHEYIFLLTKSPKYYYDFQGIKEAAETEPQARDKSAEGYTADYPTGERFSSGMRVYGADGMRNKRDVWSVTVGGGYKSDLGQHFATYPIRLIEPCIIAGCPQGGVVLDPFNGTGTTGACALQHDRKYIGVELNKEYVDIATERLNNTLTQFSIFNMGV